MGKGIVVYNVCVGGCEGVYVCEAKDVGVCVGMG